MRAGVKTNFQAAEQPTGLKSFSPGLAIRAGQARNAYPGSTPAKPFPILNEGLIVPAASKPRALFPF